MQEGIIPAWEDEANKNGGKWSIQLPREKNRGHVDKFWLYTVSKHHLMFELCLISSFSLLHSQMLAAIGETFDPYLTQPDTPPGTPSLVTGVIVSTRPQFYRLSIWTRLAPSSEDDKLKERIESVGKHFKTNVLGYPEAQRLAGALSTEVEFLSLKDSEKKGKQAKKIIV